MFCFVLLVFLKDMKLGGRYTGEGLGGAEGELRVRNDQTIFYTSIKFSRNKNSIIFKRK